MSVVVNHPRYGEIALKVIPPGTLGKAEARAADQFLLEDLWLYGSSWADFKTAFFEKGAALERAYKSAEHRGDVIGLRNVVARMKKWSDTADARWAIEDPEGFRTELVEREGRELLQTIAKRLQRDQLRALKAENDERLRDSQRDELRRIADRWRPVKSVDLPARFEPVVKFALRKCALYPSQRPTIKLTGVGEIFLGGVPENCYGIYRRSAAEVRVRHDLSDEQTIKTLIHEILHHAAHLQGWWDTERFVWAEEDRHYAEWLEESDTQELAA